MNNVVSVITESKEDVVAIRTVMGKRDKLRFWACDGKMGLTSLARNVAVHEKTPVIVICSDTDDIDLIQELVGNMSGNNRCRVFKAENGEKFCRKIVRAAKELSAQG